MRKFKVEVEGRNFLIKAHDRIAKHGFYTNRIVEAADKSEAEMAAVAQLRERQSLREMTKNVPADPPTVHVIKIIELDSFDGLKSLDQGLAWYPEEDIS